MIAKKYSILFMFLSSKLIVSTFAINRKVRLENLKFLEKLEDNLKNPDKFYATVQAALEDSAHMEEIFGFFEAADFSVSEQDWDRAKELERFKSVMSSEGDEAEKFAYLEIILKKFGISRLSELEEIYTMSESLQFIVDYYKNAAQVADKGSKLVAFLTQSEKNFQILLEQEKASLQILTSICDEYDKLREQVLHEEVDAISFIQDYDKRNMEQFQKYQTLSAKSLGELKSANSKGLEIAVIAKEMNNLMEMTPIVKKHAFHVNLQIGIGVFKPTREGQPVSLEVVEKLIKFYVTIEGLKNIILLEKDLTKRENLQEELRSEEELLADFLTQDTSEQIINVIAETSVLLTKTSENLKSLQTMQEVILQDVKKKNELGMKVDELTAKYSDHLKKMGEILVKMRENKFSRTEF